MAQPQEEQPAAGAGAGAEAEPAKAAAPPPRLMLSRPKPAAETEPEPVARAGGEVAEAPAAAAAIVQEPKLDEEAKASAGDSAPTAQTEGVAETTSLKRQVRPPARLQASAGDGAKIEEAPQVLGLTPRARGARDGTDLEVDWVIDKREGKDGVEYKVRWVGYANAEDTWEPLANLTSAKAKVDDFELRDKRKRGAADGEDLDPPPARPAT